MVNIHVMVMSCSCHIHCAPGPIIASLGIHTKVTLQFPGIPDWRYLQQRRFGPQSPMRHLRIEAPGATNQTRGVEASNDMNSDIFERIYIEVS